MISFPATALRLPFSPLASFSASAYVTRMLASFPLLTTKFVNAVVNSALSRSRVTFWLAGMVSGASGNPRVVARPEALTTRPPGLSRHSIAGKGSRTNCQLLGVSPSRSEEHTSELQSHSDLVCRLLLEKKKKQETQK